MKHIPVLLKETIEILNPREGEFFIDGTIGSGGHAVKILEKIFPSGKLLGVDWDNNSLGIAKERILIEFRIQNSELRNNLILINGNYADLPEILKEHGLPKADGIILDLGFSSETLESGKGFSFLKNEPLDMRYCITRTDIEYTRTNTDSPHKSVLMTAAEVVNGFSEEDLADIFWKYGEERQSRQIAKKIIEERKKKLIKTTFDLARIIIDANPRMTRTQRIHPATRVFQALRIYVNDELENLENFLKNINETIKPKGRVAIISFHSLEDRIVKNRFREMAKDGKAEILTKKPITPALSEIRNNPRSRSAKLRAIILAN